MAKKRNWDRIRRQEPSDTMKYRDVYEDQQLERSQIEELQSPTSRILIAAIVGVLAAILMYFLVCILHGAFTSFRSIMDDSSTESTYDDGYANSYEEFEEMFEFGVIYKESEYGTGGWVDKETGAEYTQTELYTLWQQYEAERDAYRAQTSDESSTEVGTNDGGVAPNSMVYYFLPTWWKVLISLGTGLIVFLILYQVLMRNLEAQNLMNDTKDINQYQNDQHIALPEEVQRKFDWFPDVGAHSNVQFSSMISHMAIQNKGLKKIQVALRADIDMLDEDGDIAFLKGEVLTDDDGNVLYEEKELIDIQFMEDLFEASGLPKDKHMRKYYDTTKIPYNPDGRDRDKLGKFATVADLINADWEFPYYEPQRPAGAYIVDTAPVNTIKLAYNVINA